MAEEDASIPNDLRYSEQDEWARDDDDRIVLGITDYAQQQLGDVVFLELPEVGTTLTRGEPFGVIESVKAVSDLYAPVSGEVVEVNGLLAERPDLVNLDCYGEGWMLAVEADAAQLQELLDAMAYKKLVEERSD